MSSGMRDLTTQCEWVGSETALAHLDEARDLLERQKNALLALTGQQ